MIKIRCREIDRRFIIIEFINRDTIIESESDFNRDPYYIS